MSSVLAEIAQGAAGGLLGGIKSILGTFVADKSEDAKDKAAYALQQLIGNQAEVQAQLAIAKAEAESPDRINHYRGGLGWTCAAGWFWQLIAVPIVGAWHPLPVLPDKVFDSLVDLTMVLITGHVVGQHVMPNVQRIFKSKYDAQAAG